MNKSSFFKPFHIFDNKIMSLQALRKIQPRHFFFLGVMLVVLVYLKPIFSVWLYSDESDYFSESTTIGRQFAEDGNLFGSFIYNHVSLLLANSVEDLWRLRLLSLICLLLIINNFSAQVMLFNQSRVIQFLIPFTLTLPAPMTFISFAMIWQGSLGMLMAYFASIFWLKSNGGIRIVSIIILSLSMTMSPVSAFAIFGVHAALFILTRARAANYLKTVVSLLFLYGISGALSVLTLLFVKSVFNIEFSARVGLVNSNDIPEKIYWIFSRPIAVSVRFFDISSPSTFNALTQVLLVSTLLVLGFVRQNRVLKENVFKRIFIFVMLVLLSITPLIITWSNQIEFRYIFGPSFAVFLAASMMVLELMHLKKKIYVSLSLILSISIATLGIVTVANNTDRQFVSPFKSKNDFIVSEISNCLERDPVINQLIIKSPQTGFPSRKNIGIFSQITDLDSPWVPVPAVKNVLKMLELEVSDVALVSSNYRESKGACVVDLESYRQILLNENE